MPLKTHPVERLIRVKSSVVPSLHVRVIFSRAFGDGPLNLDPRSSEKDDTPSPNFPTPPIEDYTDNSKCAWMRYCHVN
ncbi:hypothetical protein TNCV_3610741 [Trichonephila clavipes]|nr:hypothetical protein TNCV_3610741 [Trichonephila clavipes]